MFYVVRRQLGFMPQCDTRYLQVDVIDRAASDLQSRLERPKDPPACLVKIEHMDSRQQRVDPHEIVRRPR